MKISVLGTKGFQRPHRSYRVTMDGRELQRVFQVDTTTGVAWVAQTDKNGGARFEGDRIAMRRVFGPMRLEEVRS